MAAVCSLAILSIVAAAAQGEGPAPTRAEYVEQLEAICKPRVEATQRAMKGVRDDVRAERDAIAAAKFRRGAHIFAGTTDRISQVPKPPPDTAKLKKWISYLHGQESYLDAIVNYLKAAKVIKAQRAISRFIQEGKKANNVVLAFEFDYCSFKFSRFG